MIDDLRTRHTYRHEFSDLVQTARQPKQSHGYRNLCPYF